MFASAGAASAEDLHRLVIAAIIWCKSTVQVVLIVLYCFENYFILLYFLFQCKGKLMTLHGLIELLYKTDNIFGEGSVCPKLRDMHINPTSFQKMNVRLAMQVFL